ncbi:hypothetical protein QTL95_18330 [Rhizobium sp. S152]|uniref:hypothetical protein n=1 Tax=Rhizobium sp. S152 TaxID=3055038 RepID=UPI0025A96F7A|nr:hypothetical protein [Rhizobium sp. S152]MDM9627852.1 hypothetical protein [Rhizobium sp. S152]
MTNSGYSASDLKPRRRFGRNAVVRIFGRPYRVVSSSREGKLFKSLISMETLFMAHDDIDDHFSGGSITVELFPGTDGRVSYVDRPGATDLSDERMRELAGC